jgi:hypothetical protein
MLSWWQEWRRTATGRRDRGVTSIEMLGFVIPGSIAAIVVAYSAFNIGLSSIDVTSASAAAARAASQQRTAPAAVAAARQAAADNLAAGSVTCAQLDVITDTSRWGRGGSVTVTVRCTVRLRTLSGLDFIPGDMATSAKSTAPVETYRSVTS